MTLKATTRRFLRAAVMPLARRYRVDRMYDTKRLRCSIATDTMDARFQSIHGNRYYQVFANRDYFAKGYPISKKSDCHEALDKFIRDYGTPDSIKMDCSKEQTGQHTTFQKILKKYNIPSVVSEPDRPNQNPSEGTIREIRKKWYRTMFRVNYPEQLWEYGYNHVTEIMNRTASNAGNLKGRTPLELVTGETIDISKYLDFDFYDRVWFREDAGIGPTQVGRWLGVAYGYGSLMNYWILPPSGIPETRTTVQRITHVEANLEAHKEKFLAYDAKIATQFHNSILKPDETCSPEDWKNLIEMDDAFAKEISITFNNPEVFDDDTTGDSPDTDDGYLNMELAMERGGETPELAKVTEHLRDNEGEPIGTSHSNPILDSRMYEIEFPDGLRQSVAANVSAENLVFQVNQEGKRHRLLDMIVDVRKTKEALNEEDAFLISRNGIKRQRPTTQGWEIFIQ